MVWFIYLTAFQLFMGYLKPNFDSFESIRLQSKIYFQFSIAIFFIVFFFKFAIIICLHTVILYQVFQSNYNNGHTIIWLKLTLPI